MYRRDSSSLFTFISTRYGVRFKSGATRGITRVISIRNSKAAEIVTPPHQQMSRSSVRRYYPRAEDRGATRESWNKIFAPFLLFQWNGEQTAVLRQICWLQDRAITDLL